MAKQQPPRRLITKSFGLAAFISAVAATAYIIWIGVTGQPIPRWFLMLATIF